MSSSRSNGDSRIDDFEGAGSICGEDNNEGGIQANLELRDRGDLEQKQTSVRVPLGDREALLRRTAESERSFRPVALLRDQLHFSLIRRIRLGHYFPRRLLIAAGKPEGSLPGSSKSKGTKVAESHEYRSENSGRLGYEERRLTTLTVTVRGWPRVVEAAAVVNADLARLEAQVAMAGSLVRWPFNRCTPQVLVRAAIREIAVDTRKGESQLFSQGEGACATAARPHKETDPRKATPQNTRYVRRRAAGSNSTDSSSSENVRGCPTGLQTALSRPRGFRAGSPTGHTCVTVPLIEEAEKLLGERAAEKRESPAYLVRQGIDWIASIGAREPARALAWVQEAKMRETRCLQGKGKPCAERPRKEKTNSGETGPSKTGQVRISCALELCSTRRVALEETIRSIASILDQLENEEPSGFEVQDVTRAAAFLVSGLMESSSAKDLSVANSQEMPYEKQTFSREALEEKSLAGQVFDGRLVASRENRMSGSQLFEKPGGQDRGGRQVSIAITPEAKAQLRRKARRYFREGAELARLAIRRMIWWVKKSPVEAFEYIQKESDLYQPPRESNDYQPVYQLYLGLETEFSIRRARRALQRGPGSHLDRRVTRRRILQAAARLGIESVEVSAPI